MVRNLKIFESGMQYGNMNTAKAFHQEHWTPSQREQVFLMSRLAAGLENGFDGRKMFMADQKDKRGTWFEITMDYVRENPLGWSDIRQDILVITNQLPEVIIGHPVADCPVVIAFDRAQKIAAIGHCSAELIDKKMPMMVADALYNSYRSKDEDIYTYVTACAGPNWTYDSYPNWAKDSRVWENAITEEDGLFHIDMRKAIEAQLKARKVGKIDISPIDTITDPNFFSNYASSPKGLNQPEKAGRNFAGCYFVDSSEPVVKEKKR